MIDTNLTFNDIIQLLANNLFDGSTTLAGLSLMLAGWAIFAVICFNFKAPPVYSVVPMIPLAIFFNAYGILNETIMLLIVIISAALVASEFKKVVD